MSTKNLELPYICINCAEHPTNVPGYFNPSLKSGRDLEIIVDTAYERYLLFRILLISSLIILFIFWQKS